ncbi:MAG: hypothetical protein JNK82_32305 [Myxococcaceae bacterium]|nr:hypothetical protein [Myxococcaceae bacterium]
MHPVNTDLEQVIRERPEELGPWRAYSDWLLQQGHPRGELMARMMEREQHPNVGAEASRERDAAIAALARQLDPELNDGSMLPGSGYRRGFKTRHTLRVFGGKSLVGFEQQVNAPGLRLLRDAILQLEWPIAGAELARVGEVLAGAAFPPGLGQLEVQAHDHIEWGRAERAAFVKLFGACSRLGTFIARSELPVAPGARDLRLTCSPPVAAAIARDAAKAQALALTLTDLDGAAAALEGRLPELRALRVEPVDDALLVAVLAAPWVRQLTKLDLSPLPDTVPSLVAVAPRLLAVPELVLRGVWRGSPQAELLAAAFPRAKLIYNVRL